jgi:TP901 family phage tail tape measure protein
MNAEPMVWEIRFKDMASKSVKRFGATTKQEADKARTAFQRVAGAVKTLAGRFASLTAAAVGITTIVTTLQSVVRVLRQGVGDAVAFDKAMVEVSTISEDVAENMGEVSRQVLDLSTAFGIAETVASKALYQTISAGVTDTAEALKLLEGATTLSIGGLADLKNTVDVLTDTINAYGFSVQDVDHINNVFFETVRLGKTTVQELAEGLGVVTPVAAELGVELEELMAMLATLTKGGIDNTTAIIYMRQALVSVLKPSTQAQELIEKLGLEFNLAKIKSDGFIGLLDDLREKLGGDTYALQTLFPNVRALVPVMALAGSRFEEFNTILGELSRSTLDEAAPAMRALERVMLSSGRQIEVLGNAARQGVMELGLAFIEGLTGPIDSVEALQAAAFAIRDGIAGMSPVINAFAGSLLYMVSLFPHLIEAFAGLSSMMGVSEEAEARLRQSAENMQAIGDLAREAAGSLIVGGDGAASALLEFGKGLEARRRDMSNAAIEAVALRDQFKDLGSAIVLSMASVSGSDMGAFTEAISEAGEKYEDDLTLLLGIMQNQGRSAADALEETGSQLSRAVIRGIEGGFSEGGALADALDFPLSAITDQLERYGSSSEFKSANDAVIQALRDGIEGGAQTLGDLDLPPLALAVIGETILKGVNEAESQFMDRMMDFKVRAGREFTTVFDEIARTVDASELESIFADIVIQAPKISAAEGEAFDLSAIQAAVDSARAEIGPGLERFFADAQEGIRSGGTATFEELKKSLPAEDFARVAADIYIQMSEQLEAASEKGVVSPKALQNLRTQIKSLQAEVKRLGGEELQLELEARIVPDIDVAPIEMDPLLTEEAIQATKDALRSIGMELEVLEARASKSFEAQRREIRLTTQESIQETTQRLQNMEITGVQYDALVKAFLAGERERLNAVDQSERAQAMKRQQAAEKARQAQVKLIEGYQKQVQESLKVGDAAKGVASVISGELTRSFQTMGAASTTALGGAMGMLHGVASAAAAAAASVAGLAAKLNGLSASEVAAQIGGDLASLVGSVDLPVLDRLDVLQGQLGRASQQIEVLRAQNLVSPEVLADLERLTDLAEQGAYKKLAENAISAGNVLQTASSLIVSTSESSTEALVALKDQIDGLDLEGKFSAMGSALGSVAVSSFEQLASMAPARLEQMVADAQEQLDMLKTMQIESETGEIMPLVGEDEIALMQARIDMINSTAIAQSELNQTIADYVTESGKGSSAGNAFRGSLQNLATQFSNIGQMAGDLVANQLQALTGGLADMFVGVMDGSKDSSEAWKEFAANFIKGLLQMTMQMLMMYGVSMMLQALGIPVGVMMGGANVAAQAMGGVNEGGLGELVPVKGFATGGVVEGLGRMTPVRGYATGGPIVNEPHVALIGEGQYNEAVVPLPDGRSIPVQMTGQQDARPVSVNFQIQAFDSKDVTRVIQGQEDQIKSMIMQAVMEDRAFRGRMG